VLRQMMAGAGVIAMLVAGCSTQGHRSGPFGNGRPGPAGSYIKGRVVIGKIYDIEGVLQPTAASANSSSAWAWPFSISLHASRRVSHTWLPCAQPQATWPIPECRLT
jgi:hypothetical protein